MFNNKNNNTNNNTNNNELNIKKYKYVVEKNIARYFSYHLSFLD